MKKTLTAAAILAALLVPATPAFAAPDTGTDTSTTETETGGDRSLGDVIHDIFCPPEDDEEEPTEEEEAAPEPPKVEVAVEAPAKPVTTGGDRDEPVCSTDPQSVNYCPPEDDAK